MPMSTKREVVGHDVEVISSRPAILPNGSDPLPALHPSAARETEGADAPALHVAVLGEEPGREAGRGAMAKSDEVQGVPDRLRGAGRSPEEPIILHSDHFTILAREDGRAIRHKEIHRMLIGTHVGLGRAVAEDPCDLVEVIGTGVAVKAAAERQRPPRPRPVPRKERVGGKWQRKVQDGSKVTKKV